MTMEETASPRALESAQNLLLLTAVRALMESHPDAAAFRESWAHCLSLVLRDHSRDLAGQPDALADAGAALRKLQPIWESYFPDSPGAKSKSGRD